jgi:hypothetical protein
MGKAQYGTLDTLQRDIHLNPKLARIPLLIHDDVKSENILICRHQACPYVARLSVFGLSLINPDVTRDEGPTSTALWDFSLEGARVSAYRVVFDTSKLDL